MPDIKTLCDQVRQVACDIHVYHGHGHLEKVQENALAHRLRKAGSLAGEEADDKYITELLGNREVDFDSFFSANPELNQRNIGLEQKAFADFEF